MIPIVASCVNGLCGGNALSHLSRRCGLAGKIKVQDRATQGLRIMNERPGDEVAAVARII
jgi:hypothetical protein